MHNIYIYTHTRCKWKGLWSFFTNCRGWFYWIIILLISNSIWMSFFPTKAETIMHAAANRARNEPLISLTQNHFCLKPKHFATTCVNSLSLRSFSCCGAFRNMKLFQGMFRWITSGCLHILVWTPTAVQASIIKRIRDVYCTPSVFEVWSWNMAKWNII